VKDAVPTCIPSLIIDALVFGFDQALRQLAGRSSTPRLGQYPARRDLQTAR
jgi:hypothetical protein